MKPSLFLAHDDPASGAPARLRATRVARGGSGHALRTVRLRVGV